MKLLHLVVSGALSLKPVAPVFSLDPSVGPPADLTQGSNGGECGGFVLSGCAVVPPNTARGF